VTLVGRFEGVFAMAQPQTVTVLLEQISGGDEQAVGSLFELLYDELRRRADRYMANERPDHTLQPTALVHEAFAELVEREGAAYQSRAHFFYAAAQAMRRLLLDHSAKYRRRQSLLPRVDGDGIDIAGDAEDGVDIEALDAAMKKLEALDSRRHRVVMLRYFAGRSDEEIAELMGVSAKTVRRDWATAKVFLKSEMTNAG
jgi:RNA polymerase sigma-70 factor, ECF subfamily